MGVFRGVLPTTGQRSRQKGELQIPCFEEFSNSGKKGVFLGQLFKLHSRPKPCENQFLKQFSDRLPELVESHTTGLCFGPNSWICFVTSGCSPRTRETSDKTLFCTKFEDFRVADARTGNRGLPYHKSVCVCVCVSELVQRPK